MNVNTIRGPEETEQRNTIQVTRRYCVRRTSAKGQRNVLCLREGGAPACENTVEIKHDGYRLIARDGAGARLLTRNGHDWSDRYPAIANAVGRLRCRSCVIDSEVAILDDESRAVFEPLQQDPRVKPEAILFAFDLIEIDGEDLRREPLLTRKSTLLSLLKGVPAGIVYNEHPKATARCFFRHACRLGCEGIVSKRADSSYRSGHSRDWIKTKAPAAIAAQRARSENWNVSVCCPWRHSRTVRRDRPYRSVAEHTKIGQAITKGVSSSQDIVVFFAPRGPARPALAPCRVAHRPALRLP